MRCATPPVGTVAFGAGSSERSAGTNVISSTTALPMPYAQARPMPMIARDAGERQRGEAQRRDTAGGDHHRAHGRGRRDDGRTVVAEPLDLLDVALEHLRRVPSSDGDQQDRRRGVPASMTRPVWPISPSPHTVLSTAVSIGMSMPWRLRNDTSSMSAMTRKVNGMRSAHLARLLDVGQRHDRLAGEIEVDRTVAEAVGQVAARAAPDRRPVLFCQKSSTRTAPRWSGVTTMPRSCGSASTLARKARDRLRRVWHVAHEEIRFDAAVDLLHDAHVRRRQADDVLRDDALDAQRGERRVLDDLEDVGLPHVALARDDERDDRVAPAELPADRPVDRDQAGDSPAGSPRR